MVSLRSLTRLAATPPRDTTTRSDDSGLIDLRALAAMNEGQSATPKLEVAPFAGVGLFDVPDKAPEPPPALAEKAPARSTKPRAVALVAGVAVVVAALSALAIGVARSSRDVPQNANLPPVTAAHSVAAADPPPPAEQRPEAPAPAEIKTANPAPRPLPTSNPGPSRRGPRPQGSATVRTDPPKPAPACDLMCQMQKSVAKSR